MSARNESVSERGPGAAYAASFACCAGLSTKS